MLTGSATLLENNDGFNGTTTSLEIQQRVANGGAILTKYNVIVTFNGTNNLANNNNRGAISAQENTLLSFNGTSHNSAVHDCGGAVSTYNNVILSFSGSTNFVNNSAFQGGAIYAAFNKLLSFSGTNSFSRNSALQGGAIFANHDSVLTFNKSISFTNNGNYIHNDSQGGAMYLYSSSNFSILPNTTVCWENNHSTLGGAIYVSNVNHLVYCTQTGIFYTKRQMLPSTSCCPVLSNLFSRATLMMLQEV